MTARGHTAMALAIGSSGAGKVQIIMARNQIGAR
jgi:hypothetical protein